MPAAPKANPPIRTLLGPGPSPVSPRVLAALALPVVGHLDPKFLEIMDQSMAMLRELFQTKNRLALPMSGTGSAGMETCFVNLIEPGDRVLIGVNGVFGTRMVDVAQRCGAQVDTVEAEWGTALDAQKVKERAGQEQIQTGRRGARRDFHRRAPADGRYRQAGARQRRALGGRCRHFVGRRAGAGRRAWHRRLLQRHAEMSGLPAGAVAGDFQRTRHRSDPPAQDQGAELVSRSVDDREILGQRARLSSHRADLDELRACTKRCASSSKKDWKNPGSATSRPTRCLSARCASWRSNRRWPNRSARR